MRNFLRKQHQFVRFVIGGLLSFLWDLCIIYILLHFNFSKDVALVLAYFISAFTFALFFHTNITFEAALRANVVFKYAITSVVVFIVDIYLSIYFSDIILYYYKNIFDNSLLVLVGKTIGAFFGGILGFILLKFWVFKNKKVDFF